MPRPARLLAALATPLVVGALLGAGCGGDAAPAPGGFEVRAESLVTADSALRYTARLAYPRIVGETPGVVAANRALADTARALVALYRPPGPLPPELATDPTFVASVEGGFETALTRDSLYSGLLHAYAFTGGAHGMHDVRPLNVDLRTGRTLDLPALFRAGTPWVDTLAARGTRQLAARLGPDVLFEGHVPADPARFRAFTLGADSLAVVFPPYAVAPYAAGPQRVAFAWAALRPLLDPAGPARFFIREAPREAE